MTDMSTAPPEIRTAILELISDAVMITDACAESPGPRIVYVNPAFEDMTGYSAGELLGENPRILQGPDTDRSQFGHLRRALANGEECTGEVINYRRNGEPFLLEWRISPFRDESGQITHFISISRDVTHARKRDRRYDELETLARVQSDVAAGGLDIDTVRQRVADVALSISGAESAVVEEPDGGDMVYRAVAGKAYGHLGNRLPIHGSLSGACYRELRAMICTDTFRDDRVATEAARAVGFRSGVLIPLCRGYRCFGVIKVYSGGVNRFSSAERDLLQLASGMLANALESAHTYRSERHRREALVDALPIMIAYIDRDGCFREMNTACERWFGRPRERLVGHGLRAVLGEDGFAAVEPYVNEVLKGKSVHFQTQGTFRNNDVRYVEGNYTPDRDYRGRVRGFYSVVRDVTGLQTLYVDYLTKVGNRRQLEEKGAGLIESARRYGRPLSLIMLDVDHFKAVNDSHGHQAGDAVLRQLGLLLGHEARAADLLARWGGEEFAILAPETTASDAATFAERIRARVSDHEFSPVGHVTASIGVTELAGAEEDMETLQRRADQALYEAKRAGRNRIVNWHACSAARQSRRK